MGIVVAFVVGLLAVTSCDLSDPIVSPSPGDDVNGGSLDVALECSSDFFLFGPRKLAVNYGLNSFDPKQVAYTWATGHFIRDEAAQAACSSAFAFAEGHYLYAKSLGWPPYRSQELWLWRWYSYYVCAQMVSNDDALAATLRQGSPETRSAAIHALARSSSEEGFHRLWAPAYDGCLQGLRFDRKRFEQVIGSGNH